MGSADNSIATKKYVDSIVTQKTNTSDVYNPTSSQAMSGVAVAEAIKIESGETEQGIIYNRLGNHITCIYEGKYLYSSSSPDYLDNKIRVYMPEDATAIGSIYGYVRVIYTEYTTGNNERSATYYHKFSIDITGELTIYTSEDMNNVYVGGVVL